VTVKGGWPSDGVRWGRRPTAQVHADLTRTVSSSAIARASGRDRGGDRAWCPPRCLRPDTRRGPRAVRGVPDWSRSGRGRRTPGPPPPESAQRVALGGHVLGVGGASGAPYEQRADDAPPVLDRTETYPRLPTAAQEPPNTSVSRSLLHPNGIDDRVSLAGMPDSADSDLVEPERDVLLQFPQQDARCGGPHLPRG
jgi:hypothetical protein